MSCMRPAGSFRSEKFFLLLALSMKKISEKRGCGNFYPPKKTKRGPCGQGPEKIISEKSCAGRKRLNALKSQSSSRSGAMPHTGGRAGQNKKLSHVSALLARLVRYIWAKTKKRRPAYKPPRQQTRQPGCGQRQPCPAKRSEVPAPYFSQALYRPDKRFF